jgi:hypothetical protein
MKFLKNIFKSLFTDKDPMKEYENNQKKIRESLTNLLFQHSKVIDKQDYLMDENEHIALDLEEAVKANEDELSLTLIAKLEQNKEELIFLDEQLKTLEINITELKETKKEIDLSKGRYKDLLDLHESKKIALNAKKEMLSQLNELNESRATLNSNNYLGQLKDQIHKANAEIALLQDETNTDNTISKLRRNRVKRDHLNKLNTLKHKLQNNEVVIVK